MKNLFAKLKTCLFGTQVVVLSKEEANRMKRRCVRWELRVNICLGQYLLFEYKTIIWFCQ